MQIYIIILLLQKIYIQKNSNYPFYHKPPFKKYCHKNDKVIIKKPIVLFPGCNDNCFGVAHVEENLIKHSHHKIICLEYAHQMQTIVTNLQQLITYACKVLEQDRDLLQNGFYAVGLSMGGLISRGVLQQCDIGQYLQRIVAIGTPHLGVMKLPSRDNTLAERILNQLTRSFIYIKPIQRFISGANMFRDLDRYDQYLASGSPLIDLNNEKNFNLQYKQRMESLQLFINISFSNEEYLLPKETAQWGYFKQSGSDEILTFQETDFYKKDLLGLQKLYKEGKLLFEEVHGKHQDAKVRFNDCWAKVLYYFYQLNLLYKYFLYLNCYMNKIFLKKQTIELLKNLERILPNKNYKQLQQLQQNCFNKIQRLDWNIEKQKDNIILNKNQNEFCLNLYIYMSQMHEQYDIENQQQLKQFQQYEMTFNIQNKLNDQKINFLLQRNAFNIEILHIYYGDMEGNNLNYTGPIIKNMSDTYQLQMSNFCFQFFNEDICNCIDQITLIQYIESIFEFKQKIKKFINQIISLTIFNQQYK